jgi:hypothetical protein
MENVNIIKRLAGAAIALGALGFTTQASAAQELIVNEWNAVGPGKVLDDCVTPGPADPIFGCSTNNGADWIELVVTKNIASIVDWVIYWENDDSGGHANEGTLRFVDGVGFTHNVWNNLKAGTIITLRHNDSGASPSSNPCGSPGDWWIRVDSNDPNYISYDGGDVLKTDNDCWNVKIEDDTFNVVQNWLGEDGGSCNNSPVSNPTWNGSGLGNTEVGKLEANPVGVGGGSNTNYVDGDCSSFGRRNCWNDGASVQNFASLCNVGCGGSYSNCGN